MIPSAPLRVAIVGAGIGGLTAACALRQRGAEVHVFEQAQRFARVGAGIQMAPNAMRVLRALGAEGRLRETGLEPVSNMNLEHDTGRITNDLPLAGEMERKYGAPFLCLHRADLHASLEALLPPEIVSLETKVSDFHQDSTGVSLTLSDGARPTFDVLIGADGIHSLIRDKLFGPHDATYTGRVAYRATYPASRLNGFTFAPSRIKWWGPGRHVVMFYTHKNHDEVYVTTVQSEPGDWITKESWSAKGDLSHVLHSFRDFHPDVRRVLEACQEVYKWAIQQRSPMERWSVGRVALLGDACHAMTPHMAQGGAQALEDAAILARCLAEVGSRSLDAIVAALLKYENTRKARTTKIQLMATHNTWMRDRTDPDWLYGYDAFNAPLE